MKMYKHPRAKDEIIRRLGRLGFSDLTMWPNGYFGMENESRESCISISDDCEHFRYVGPQGTATHESVEFDDVEWYQKLLDAIYQPIIEPGMLVIYDPGYKVEFGKVKRLNGDGTKAFVWYHCGDTAACTRIEDLYPVEKEFVLKHKDMFENAYAIDDVIAKGEQQ